MRKNPTIALSMNLGTVGFIDTEKLNYGEQCGIPEMSMVRDEIP